MKRLSYIIILFTAVAFTACHEKNKQEKWEDEEAAKVGKVYNHDIQGIGQENQKNQFPASRNKSNNETETVSNTANDTLTSAATQNKM